MVEEKFIRTRFGKIHYLVDGDGEDTIIFLHGWVGWPALFRTLANSFSSDFRVVAPYLPGHGKSFALRRGTSFSDVVLAMADFLGSLCDSRGKIILLGHSLGGSIAWELAEKRLKSNDKLVLVDPMLAYTGDSVIRLTSLWLHDRTKDYLLGRRKWDPVAGALRFSRVQFSPVGLWNVVKTVRVNQRRLPEEIKVMVMWGRDDHLVPLNKNKEIIDKCAKGAKWRLFSGGHYWFGGQIDGFIDSLKAFVSETV